MDKDEALKMVINWFEGGDFYYPEELLNACKEALEQPVQEPVAWRYKFENDLQWQFTTRLDVLACNDLVTEELYTHPHQDKTSPSKWTALTDDEIDKLHEYARTQHNQIKSFARAIEQTLKDKNHG